MGEGFIKELLFLVGIGGGVLLFTGGLGGLLFKLLI